MSLTVVAEVLETPDLDTESSRLLQDISEHGGYAYVSMAGLAASGDSRAAETAREMAWEQLHSGPWHSVLPVWRDAYSMACLYVAKFHYAKGELQDALRVLDMGLIMGGTLLRKDLDASVEKVSEAARARERLEGLWREHSLVQGNLDNDEEHRVLPMKSLSCKNVVKMSSLSVEGFLRDYFLLGCPVIISDCMAHWPASTKWNDLDYLKMVAGDRTVPVEQQAVSQSTCR